MTQQFIDRWRKRINNNIVLAVMSVLITALAFLLVAYLCNVLNVIISAITSGSLSGMEMPSLRIDTNKYMAGYIIGVVFGLILSVRLVYTVKSRNMEINAGQKGKQSFAELKEIKEQYKAVPDRKKRFKGGGGVVISRYKKMLYVDNSSVNNIIIGTTRSGKGQVFVIPSIDVYSRAEEQPSLIINDPKGELAPACIPILKKRGYNTYLFNLMDTLKGISYNPLELIKQEYLKGDKGGAQLLARTFSYMIFNDPNAKDKTWQDWAISLSNALILAHVIDCVKNKEEEKINMYSCNNMISRFSGIMVGKDKTLLDYFFEQRPNTDIAKLQYAACKSAPARTKGSIIAQLLSKFESFTYDNVAKMTAQNTVNMEDIGFDMTKPTAVFMVTPDYDPSLHFLASLFIRQLYYVLAKKASRAKGNKCPREVVFMLDEFGTMPAIPDMATIIPVCLGRNIRFNLIIQSYAQIEAMYGKNDADTITDNCGNQIYLLTTSTETAKRFSELLGTKTIITYGRSGDSRFFGKSMSEHVDSEPLLDHNRLMSFEIGETAVVRPLKRETLKKKRVRPKPIHNCDETGTRMLYSYEYAPELNKELSLESVEQTGAHAALDLNTIIYYPEESMDLFQEPDPDAKKSVSPVSATTPLSEFLSPEEMINLNSFIGVDNDYPKMTYGEFLSFVLNLVEVNGITRETGAKALKYVDTIKENFMQTSIGG